MTTPPNRSNVDVALEGFTTPAPASEPVVCIDNEGLHKVELAGGLHAGIDPGLDGWWALIDPTGSILVDCGKLPTIDGAKKREYDEVALRELFEGWRGRVTLVTLEKQQAMKDQGVSSTFTTGLGYGLLRMGLVCAHLRRELVHAATWKAKMGCRIPSGSGITGSAPRKKEAKRLSVAKVQGLYPDVDLRREPGNKRMKPDHNKADAILLACYGYRKRLGVL